MKRKIFKIILISICVIFLFCLGVRWRMLTPSFLSSSSTGHILDTRFWYNIDEGYKIIAGFSSESFKIYNELLIWDSFLPFVYCYLSIQIFSILPRLKKKIKFIPFTAMIFDYLENIFVYIIMMNSGKRLNSIMAAANISGSIKTIFQYITWLLIFIVIVVWAILKLIKVKKNGSIISL